MSVDLERRLQRGQQAAAHELDLVRRKGARQDGDELVAADAGQRIAVAQRLAQAARGLAQHGVADRVAEAVVDFLEAVQPDGGDAEALPGTPRIGDHHADPVGEQQAVRQFRQRVVRRHMAQALFGGALGRHVAADGQQFMAVREQADAQFEPDVLAGAAQPHFDEDRVAGRAGIDDGIAQGGLVDVDGERRQYVAGQRLRAERALGAPTRMPDQAGGIEAERDVAHRFHVAVRARRRGRMARIVRYCG
jgi:hypothetical protein